MTSWRYERRKRIYTRICNICSLSRRLVTNRAYGSCWLVGWKAGLVGSRICLATKFVSFDGRIHNTSLLGFNLLTKLTLSLHFLSFGLLFRFRLSVCLPDCLPTAKLGNRNASISHTQVCQAAFLLLTTKMLRSNVFVVKSVFVSCPERALIFSGPTKQARKQRSN